MKEHPILFNGEMVRAILEGRKTQTRRVIKPQPDLPYTEFHHLDVIGQAVFTDNSVIRCPYGQVGDRLWVRETWAVREQLWVEDHYEPDGRTIYRADGESSDAWKPSIHMFRRDSRINLPIIRMRVERVQDISEEDCKAEGIIGVPTAFGLLYKPAFARLWDSINAKRGYGWAVNPWVWAITFKVVSNEE